MPADDFCPMGFASYAVTKAGALRESKVTTPERVQFTFQGVLVWLRPTLATTTTPGGVEKDSPTTTFLEALQEAAKTPADNDDDEATCSWKNVAAGIIAAATEAPDTAVNLCVGLQFESRTFAIPTPNDGVTPRPLRNEEERRKTGIEFGNLPFRGLCSARGVIETLRQIKKTAATEPSVIVMCGAGISVAAGIPDFRTPGVGLYDNLEKYGLPSPQDLFCLEFFREKPEVFYAAANEMKLLPGSYAPTPTHHFLALLHEAGLLLRCYTQNIDGLERLAGVPAERLVEAHGTFSAAHCVKCGVPVDPAVVRDHVARKDVPRCAQPSSDDTGATTPCNGVIKPDVVFFGESLPERFTTTLRADVKSAKLLLVLGTSLVVYPFASIHEWATCPRVLVNRERAGKFDFTPGEGYVEHDGEGDGDDDDDFGSRLPSAIAEGRGPWCHDVFLQGDCQAVTTAVAEGMGLGTALAERVGRPKANADAAQQQQQQQQQQQE